MVYGASLASGGREVQTCYLPGACGLSSSVSSSVSSCLLVRQLVRARALRAPPDPPRLLGPADVAALDHVLVQAKPIGPSQLRLGRARRRAPDKGLLRRKAMRAAFDKFSFWPGCCKLQSCGFLKAIIFHVLHHFSFHHVYVL